MVEVEERIWRSVRQSYQRTFCELIGVRPRGRSRALTRVLSDFGAEHAFAQAALRVKEHYGFELNSSAVRTATLETAEHALQKLESKYAKPYPAPPATGQKQIIAEVEAL